MSSTTPAVLTDLTSYPGVYRLVSTQLTNGAKHGGLNDNITFNTNIPFPSYAMRIHRIRWLDAWSGWAEVAPVGASEDIQLFAQLTENQTKTSVLQADSSYLDEYYTSLLITQATAVGINHDFPKEVFHDFYGPNTIYTIATKLNLVVSMIENSGNLNASSVWKPIVVIEYTLISLTPTLSSYLARRLQIQGS